MVTSNSFINKYLLPFPYTVTDIASYNENDAPVIKTVITGKRLLLGCKFTYLVTNKAGIWKLEY